MMLGLAPSWSSATATWGRFPYLQTSMSVVAPALSAHGKTHQHAIEEPKGFSGKAAETLKVDTVARPHQAAHLLRSNTVRKRSYMHERGAHITRVIGAQHLLHAPDVIRVAELFVQ